MVHLSPSVGRFATALFRFDLGGSVATRPRPEEVTVQTPKRSRTEGPGMTIV